MAEAVEVLLYEFAAEPEAAAASWGTLRSCALRAWRTLDVMGRVLVLAALFSSQFPASRAGVAAALVAMDVCSLLVVARAALGPLHILPPSSFALIAGLPRAPAIYWATVPCITRACRRVFASHFRFD